MFCVYVAKPNVPFASGQLTVRMTNGIAANLILSTNPYKEPVKNVAFSKPVGFLTNWQTNEAAHTYQQPIQIKKYNFVDVGIERFRSNHIVRKRCSRHSSPKSTSCLVSLAYRVEEDCAQFDRRGTTALHLR